MGIIDLLKLPWTLIARLVWIGRHAYTVVDIERSEKDHRNLTVFIIARNGDFSDRFVYQVAMHAEQPSGSLQPSWTVAEYIPVDNDNANFVIPQGGSVHQIRPQLCLLRYLDHDGWLAYDIPPERITRDIITHSPRVTFRLQTSEGEVILTGDTNHRPVANENVPLLRRLRRVVGI